MEWAARDKPFTSRKANGANKSQLAKHNSNIRIIQMSLAGHLNPGVKVRKDGRRRVADDSMTSALFAKVNDYSSG